jgi:hypothetical protein
MPVRNEFHVDHVFPRNRFKPSKLAAAGLSLVQIDGLRDRMDRLPNLQLLDGSVNIAKQDQLPLAWAQAAHADEAQRGLYLAGHDLEGLPEDLDRFDEFYDRRRQRMMSQLRVLLGASNPALGAQRDGLTACVIGLFATGGYRVKRDCRAIETAVRCRFSGSPSTGSRSSQGE